MNLRPLGYEPSELPSCSTPRRFVKISAPGELRQIGRIGVHPAWKRPGQDGRAFSRRGQPPGVAEGVDDGALVALGTGVPDGAGEGEVAGAFLERSW